MTGNQNVSPREKEVLHLIAYEYTTKEIASKLYISPHTADSHRKNLMQKLNVRNTAGLVRIGFQSGLLRLSSMLLLIFLLGFQSQISAGHTTWTGSASDHDWFNVANWDNGVPMPTDSASISVDSVIMNAVISVEHLNLSNGARLVITPSGSLSFNNSTTALECTDAIIYNYGIVDIQIPMGEGLVLKGASVFNNFTTAKLIVFGSDSTSILNETDAVIRNQAGGLIFIESCKEPMQNNGMIDNRGAIHINFNDDSALVNSGLIDNKGLVSIDSTTTQVGLVIQDNAEFINSDTLIIKRIDREGIIVKGDFKNMSDAYVNIAGSKFTDGVEIQSTGRWNNQGKLFISDIDQNAIEIRGMMINSDSINITQAGAGLSIRDTLMNEEGGVIYIHHLNAGIGIDFFDGGVLINEGSIDMSHGLSDGINGRTTCKLENSGNILIQDLSDVGIAYVDTLINKTGAAISIVNATGRGILHQEGLISNYGKIEIDSMGLEGIGISGGEIMNYDTLLISNTSTDGIYMEGGLINNQPGAYCNIHEIVRDGIALADPNVVMINSGELIIKTTSNWGIDLDLGKLQNNGILDISNVEFIGISVGDSLINNTGGRIDVWDINDGSEAGIFNDSNGNIVNDGTIDLHNMPSDGLENAGIVLNNDSMIISMIGGRAIENYARLTNDGVIDVRDITNGVIHSGTDTLFNNGYLHVSNSSFYGLFVNAHFENRDSVVVAKSIPGINNWDTLYNYTSGVIIVDAENGATCINNRDYLHNDGEISCIIEELSSRPESTQANGIGIDVMSGSFWINTGTSTLLINASSGIMPAINIENGAEFIMFGELSAYSSSGG